MTTHPDAPSNPAGDYDDRIRHVRQITDAAMRDTPTWARWSAYRDQQQPHRPTRPTTEALEDPEPMTTPTRGEAIDATGTDAEPLEDAGPR